MKLTHISIQSVAGVSSAQVATRSPITIVAGRNGHGKSSLAQAVRMALTSDTSARGIALKKELGGLVHDGAKSGAVELTCAGLPELFALVPSGKTTPPAEYLPHPAMPFVTSPELFAQLAPNERRAFLFSLIGLSAGGPAVVERLLAKGCDRAKIDRIMPLLRSGFEAASKEAKNLATQAKGAWRAVTGETYGTVKAGEWKAAMPSAAAAEGEPTDAAKLKACDAALESWQQQVGKLQAEQQRRGELSSRLASLDEQAGRIARIERKLATDKQELTAQTARLDTLAASATGVRVGLVHELGWALNHMIIVADGMVADDPSDARALAAMAAYEREHGRPIGTGTGNPAAAAALPALRQSVEMLARAIGNDNRDLTTAERAKLEAEEIRVVLAQPAGTGLADARQQVERLKAERTTITKAIDAAAAVKRAAAEAKEKTAKASQHHADVIAWDAIGDALAPDGIPGELLGEALDPINDRLATSREISEWRLVSVKPDMSITYDNRPYALCSESEKWRADAMLAEAISHLSGLKLLVLDRFDVLDLPGRGDLIAWLDILAQDGEIDTALLCGTLKALPTGLPDTVAAHWIENGRLNGSASRELAAAPAVSPASCTSVPDLQEPAAAPAVCDSVQVEATGKQPGLPAEFVAYIDGQESAGQVEDGAADPLQKLLADAYRLGLNEEGLPGQVVGERAFEMKKVLYITDADAVQAEWVRGCSDAWKRKQEAAAVPQGEPVPPVPSNAAPAVSTSVETPARRAPGQPTAAAGVATGVPGKMGAASSPTAASAEGEPRHSTAADSELRRQAEAAVVRAGGKVVAKYRDPATGQTWSGRGLRPRWLTTAVVEEGKALDDFLITA